MTYKELILEILQQTKTPLTCEQIWLRACEIGLDKTLPSIGKTPHATIGAAIYTDMQKDKSQFITTSRKPTTFWLKAREYELINAKFDNVSIGSKKHEKIKFYERDLHPLLVKYLKENSEFNLHCKTIYHEKSKKGISGQNKWDYPDIVGIYFPYEDYKQDTLYLLNNIKQDHYKFFSFELKVSIDFSNLKESYFQAISNSSWANEGYLVVFKEISDEVLADLRRLNQIFGIGVIKLESDIVSSKILLGAKQRDLDIQTLDLLIDNNPDFAQFIQDINKQIQAGANTRIIANFDNVLSDEDMQKHLQEKHIEE